MNYSDKVRDQLLYRNLIDKLTKNYIDLLLIKGLIIRKVKLPYYSEVSHYLRIIGARRHILTVTNKYGKYKVEFYI